MLTASGGPFRNTSLCELECVSPEQACAHPNWVMGRKISVDSATMMNKGLELIEAHFLFGLPESRLDVVVHPQSIIHSMVEYADGSLLAQLSNPDMRTPIAHAMAFPERIESGVTLLDLAAIGRLDFQPPDPVRFPCLRLAHQALQAGGGAPCVLNAANEVSVEAFLAGRIRFTDIAQVNEAVLQSIGDASPPADIEGLIAQGPAFWPLQVARDIQLLRGRHRCARRLFTVAQGGVIKAHRAAAVETGLYFLALVDLADPDLVLHVGPLYRFRPVR